MMIVTMMNICQILFIAFTIMRGYLLSKELEIINDRVQYMGIFLKKDEKGKEEYFIKWKDIELGKYTG